MRKSSLQPFLAHAAAFRGDGTVGSIEAYGGVRNRFAIWRRGCRVSAQRIPCPTAQPDGADVYETLRFYEAFKVYSQAQTDEVMNRCRRLGALRRFRTVQRIAVHVP